MIFGLCNYFKTQQEVILLLFSGSQKTLLELDSDSVDRSNAQSVIKNNDLSMKDSDGHNADCIS